MDELEISGRRYLSAKRAAKENRYHSDYIGQLIRAGKILGQKVGRAWYVDAESLEKYLEAAPEPVSEIVPVAEVVKVPDVVEEPAPAVQQELVPEIKIEKETVTEEVGHSIVINKELEEKIGLRYVADDEPLLPTVRTMGDAYKNFKEHTASPQARAHKGDARFMLTAAVIGVVFFFVGALVTRYVAGVVEVAGETASAGFALMP